LVSLYESERFFLKEEQFLLTYMLGVPHESLHTIFYFIFIFKKKEKEKKSLCDWAWPIIVRNKGN